MHHQITHCHFRNLREKVARSLRVAGSMTNHIHQHALLQHAAMQGKPQGLSDKGIALSALVLPSY
jgi:hypothetical protein